MHLEPLAEPNYAFDFDEETEKKLQTARAERLDHLQTELLELNSLFKDVATLMSTQDNALRSVDTNLVAAETNTQQGMVQHQTMMTMQVWWS